jgi:hypothetical protein
MDKVMVPRNVPTSTVDLKAVAVGLATAFPRVAACRNIGE